MVTAIAVGGEPATGKSTLTRALLKPYPYASPFRYGELRGRRYEATPADLFVLGEYDEGDFGGTDRLPMTVIEDAEPFLGHLADRHPKATVYWEGDRLYNERFLKAAADAADAFHPYLLTAPPAELERRHEARDDDQSETWLRGRRTKYENLAAINSTTTLPHADEADHEAALAEIRPLLPEPVH